MAGSSEIFQTVRSAVDIVQIISEHIALKRSGREFVCLCPFHDDHRPSMRVVPHKQIFHCFVCQTGGDVFKFVTEYHKMTHGEALRYLAQKANIVLPELDRRGPASAARSQEAKSAREQLLAANEKACVYFEKLLRTEAGKAGLEYLLGRGLSEETLRQFRLGMSPDGWTGLVTAGFKAGASSDSLVAAGLAKKRSDGSLYDVFRNRVMFPILDATNHVIAFGGRVMVEKRDAEGNVLEPKYLNSPETDIFKKQETLYGLHLAKQAILKSQTAIIVEGYMDVIACHQAGVNNVVATLGTALTPEHARVLRRFCNTVVLVFDSDDAGHRAAERALEMFVNEPLDVKLASVPDGKDPCDFCMAHGGAAFQEVVANARDAMSYQWDRLQAQFKATSSLSARQEAGTQYLQFVAAAMAGRAMDPVRRGLLVDKIGKLMGLGPQEVLRTLEKYRRARTPGPAGALSSGDAPTAESAPAVDVRQLRGLAAAEGWVLGVLLSDPRLYLSVRDELSLELFAPDALRPLAEKVLEYLEHAEDLAACSLAELLSELSGALPGQAIYLQGEAEAGGKLDQKLRDSLTLLQQARSVIPADFAEPAAETDEMAKFAAEQEKIRQLQARGGDIRRLGLGRR